MGIIDNLINKATQGVSDQVAPKSASKTAKIIPEYWNELKAYSFSCQASDEKGIVTEEQVVPEGATGSEIVLDLPPQSLSITTQFATSIAATNGGFLEEHNGTVFRMITISGTTGIYPNRDNVQNKKDDSILGSVAKFLPSTAGAIGGLFKNLSSTVGSVKSLLPGEDAKKGPGGLSVEELEKTGYYKFWELYNFFVSYTEHKKTKAGSTSRLIFNCYKDNLSYIVTPLSFDMRRDASKPLLYNYTITMKAWGLATNGVAPGNFFNGPDIRNPSFIRNLLETIRRGRQTIQSASGVLKGIQSDIGEVVLGVSNVMMIGNDAIGVGADALDLYPTIKANSSAIFNYNHKRMEDTLFRYGKAKDRFNGDVVNPIVSYGAHINQEFNKLTKDRAGIVGLATAAFGGIGGAAALGVIAGKDAKNSNNASGAGTPTGETAVSQHDRLNLTSEKYMGIILDNPEAAQSIKVSDLTLPPAIQEQIDTQIKKALSITIGNVRATALKLQELSDNLAAQSGMLDPTYAAIFGIPVPKNVAKQPTEDDIIMMVDIQDMKYAMIAMTSTEQVFKEQGPNLFAAANSSLDKADQVSIPTSAYPILVNRGDSLERIASINLGDEGRAKEIAILNNLRAPYIDESGFTLPARGVTGRTFIVSNVGNIVINQAVTIKSTGQSGTRRTILNIEDIGGGDFKVTVSGPTDLDRFAFTSPTIQARLPGTVGSGDTLLMPSGDAADQTTTARKTPLLERLTHAERVFKIDIAIGADGDLAVDPNGDAARSYGYNNAIQAIRLAMETEQGELRQHKGYGIPVGIGQTNAGTSPSQIAQIISARITADPRFVDARVGTIVEGSVIRVRIEAQGASGTGRIPVEFSIQT